MNGILFHASGILSSKFIGYQNPYQLQNLKILSTFQRRTKTYMGRIFENPLVVTSSSYINLTMKLLIKSNLLAPPKKGQNKILLLFGKHYFIFASDSFCLIRLYSAPRGIIQVNWKSEFHLFWKVHCGSLKLPKNLIYCNVKAVLSYRYGAVTIR